MSGSGELKYGFLLFEFNAMESVGAFRVEEEAPFYRTYGYRVERIEVPKCMETFQPCCSDGRFQAGRLTGIV